MSASADELEVDAHVGVDRGRRLLALDHLLEAGFVSARHLIHLWIRLRLRTEVAVNVAYRVTLTQSRARSTRNPSEQSRQAARKLQASADPAGGGRGVGDEEIAAGVARRRLDGGAHQTAVRGGRPGAGSERGVARRGRTQVDRQGGGPGSDRLRNPPAGRARWTLDLFAGEMVKLTAHEKSVARDGAAALATPI